MSAACFGDFLRLADEHLEAAAAGAEREIADQVAAAWQLGRVIVGLARYLDDRVPVDVVEAMTRADLRPWDRAAVDISAALHKAADCLSQGTRTTGGLDNGGADAPARCLVAAVTSLAAGRDLLQTHLAMTPNGLQSWHSEWAPVVISPPVTRALTGQVARWSRRLASLTAGLASAGPADPHESAAVRDALQAAAQWLWAAGMAARPAHVTDPVTADDTRLLRAIPAAQAPQRLPPDGAESVPGLCAGITVSAQRLRAAVFHPADRAQRAPAASADAWRWTARAAAVTGHASELALRSLASHPSMDSGLPPGGSRLHAAVDAVTRAWTAWRQVSSTWNDLTTETRLRPAQATIEIRDLMLRMGRLTSDDPQWSPARQRGSRLRDPTGLAASGPDVVAAVHQAADALARLATADLHAVGLAGRAGRLYVPTRTLPAKHDVPRPYATAPPDRVKPVLEAYRAARDASLAAAGTLAALALAVDAPSSTLALARAAAGPHPSSLQATSQPPAIRAAPQDRPDGGGVTPGPVEQTVRSLRVTDPILLLRAAAIDTAAQTLISQADRMSGQSRPRDNSTPAARQRPSDNAARLASRDNPKPPMAQRTGSENGNDTVAISARPQAARNPQPSHALPQGHTRGLRHGRNS